MGFSRLLYPIRVLRERRNLTTLSWSAVIGESTVLEGGNYVGAHTTLHACNVGRYSYFNDRCFFANTSIGSYTCIGREVASGLGSHPVDRASIHRMFYAGSFPAWRDFFCAPDFQENSNVTIGSDVWICARCMLRDGIKIGNGSIIGANSVVTQDIEPYVIAAGSPCRPIRQRFDADIVRLFEKNKWWNYPEMAVQQAAQAGLFNRTIKKIDDVEIIFTFLESARSGMAQGSLTTSN